MQRRRSRLLSATILLSGSLARIAVAVEPEPVVFTVGGLSVLGPGSDVVNLGVGSFDVAREQGARVGAGTSAATQIECRLGQKVYVAGPVFGLIANGDGGVLGYGGIYFDTALDGFRRWRLSPILTVGAYDRGESKRLGGVFEFHLGGNLTYQLAGGTRFGVTVTHISNAFIHEENPGAEVVLLTYMFPVDSLTLLRESARANSRRIDRPSP